MIELHTAPTPNGQKIMIMLEESLLEWKYVMVSIRTGDQFTQEYLKLSPNNKIPAIVDTDGPENSGVRGRYTMMESGAILIYLANKVGKFYPEDERNRYDVLQWVMFQMAHIGPMFGQANHFNNYAKTDVQYAKDRYNNEVQRLYQVLDNRLAEVEWIGGKDYTIADMANYPWVKLWRNKDMNIEEFPNFRRWNDAMEARPAVIKVNEDAPRLREEMLKAEEGKVDVDIFNTQKNAEMLKEATK